MGAYADTPGTVRSLRALRHSSEPPGLPLHAAGLREPGAGSSRRAGTSASRAGTGEPHRGVKPYEHNRTGAVPALSVLQPQTLRAQLHHAPVRRGDPGGNGAWHIPSALS